ncbi:hypothetical protein [Embleya sp. NBC_00896]|uniref:hypothetical protein n=1 Tax=Embleya sp. NBC_00896 TaxID=2975961 RepID=UPI002F909C6B|nr:hypothetical protein OG928_35210 [Embleya sp. NBC_00896]
MTITLGIEGGPHDGLHATVAAGPDGNPPHTVTLDGARYVRQFPGIAPWEQGWHYCHRPPR